MKAKTSTLIAALVVLLALLYVAMALLHPAPSTAPIVPSQPVTPSQPKPAPRIITHDDFSQTVTVKVGTPITVMLGSDQNWTIAWSDPSLLTPIETFAATPGVQGLYTAARAGTTTLTAQGHPICAAGQACPQYIIEFTMTLVIAP